MTCKNQLSLLFLVSLKVDGIILTVGLIEDELLVEFNEGVSFTSWVPSIMSGMELFVGPLASLLINKYNPSTVAIFGSILGAGSFFISAYARNVSELIITIGEEIYIIKERDKYKFTFYFRFWSRHVTGFNLLSGK